MSFPHQAGNMTVSTCSEPADGYVVVQDVGIILANSAQSAQSKSGEKEKECMMEVLQVAHQECARLGGNYILGAHFESKQFGEYGEWMCFSLTDMACVIKKKADQMVSSSAQQWPATQLPVATAPVMPEVGGKPYNPYAGTRY
jgi:hypothetical protein